MQMLITQFQSEFYKIDIWIKFLFFVMCYGEAQPREIEQNDQQATATHGFHAVVQFISFF